MGSRLVPVAADRLTAQHVCPLASQSSVYKYYHLYIYDNITEPTLMRPRLPSCSY